MEPMRLNGKKNHGIIDSKVGEGMTIKQAYGKDASTYDGDKKAEQGMSGFGGGVRDLSSSIKGATAADGDKD
jgi:hypothetical protein